jgi:hypothetical protein
MAEQMLAPSDQPDRGRMLARPDVKTIEPPCRMLPLPYLAVGAPKTHTKKVTRGGNIGSAQRAKP